MDYHELVDSMTPELFERMRRALEVGKWPDGRALTQEQREQTMQAVILWGERHLSAQERVGFIDTKAKDGDACDSELDASEDTLLKWKD